MEQKLKINVIVVLILFCLLLGGCGTPSDNNPVEEVVPPVQEEVVDVEETEVLEEPEIIEEEPAEESKPIVVAGVIPSEENEKEGEYVHPLDIEIDESLNTSAHALDIKVEQYTENKVESISELLSGAATTTSLVPFVEINNNQPYFSDEEKITDSFAYYSMLDSQGRVGVAYANLAREMMPQESRGSIFSIRPTGWHLIRYDDIIEDHYLYNRCHLIGYQLCGCNDVRNLMTGTRYFNVSGMLPFENKVAVYIKTTGNHVLYRVTPVFEGDNTLAYGVLIEAYSVEDEGEGICFNVFVYNIQPGIEIDYLTGDSSISDNFETNALLSVAAIAAGVAATTDERLVDITVNPEPTEDEAKEPDESNLTEPKERTTPQVIVPTEEETGDNLVWVPTNGGKKYHSKPNCSQMKDPMQVTVETAEKNGYTPCGRCY